MFRKKAFIVLFLIAFLVLVQTSASAAEEQYCSTVDGYDYYVTGAGRPRNPLIYWVFVRRSDDVEYWYQYSFNPDDRTFKYSYGPKESFKTSYGKGRVEDNKLANDILYVALKIVHGE